MGRLTEARTTVPGRPEVWAGPECSFLTVGDWTCDQLALTGHDRRPSDIDRLAALGVSAVRYPVLWGRGGRRRIDTDWDWAESRLERLAGHGIEPIVGMLHHGFGPAGSDPLDPEWPVRFGRFAGEVARRFPAVRRYLPINEPLTTARFGALYGWWSPYARDPGVFSSLVLAECRAFQEAAGAIRAERPGAEIIVNEDIGRTFGSDGCRDIVDRHNARRWLSFDLVSGRVDRSHRFWSALRRSRRDRLAVDALRSEPEIPTLLGVDHYVTSDRFVDDRLERYPAWTHAEEAGRHYADIELIRVAGSPTDGLSQAVRDTWARYHLPIALTEVQLAGEGEAPVAWWLDAWDAASTARARGVEVAAVTAWSAFGAYDWATLLRQPRGSYEPGCFDITTGRPRRTPLGLAVAATANGRATRAAAGWWRHDDRILYGRDALIADDGGQHPATPRLDAAMAP